MRWLSTVEGGQAHTFLQSQHSRPGLQAKSNPHSSSTMSFHAAHATNGAVQRGQSSLGCIDALSSIAWALPSSILKYRSEAVRRGWATSYDVSNGSSIETDERLGQQSCSLHRPDIGAQAGKYQRLSTAFSLNASMNVRRDARKNVRKMSKNAKEECEKDGQKICQTERQK